MEFLTDEILIKFAKKSPEIVREPFDNFLEEFKKEYNNISCVFLIKSNAGKIIVEFGPNNFYRHFFLSDEFKSLNDDNFCKTDSNMWYNIAFTDEDDGGRRNFCYFSTNVCYLRKSELGKQFKVKANKYSAIFDTNFQIFKRHLISSLSIRETQKFYTNTQIQKSIDTINADNEDLRNDEIISFILQKNKRNFSIENISWKNSKTQRNLIRDNNPEYNAIMDEKIIECLYNKNEGSKYFKLINFLNLYCSKEYILENFENIKFTRKNDTYTDFNIDGKISINYYVTINEALNIINNIREIIPVDDYARKLYLTILEQNI